MYHIRNIDNGSLPKHVRLAFNALVRLDAPVYNHGPDDGPEYFIIGAELRDDDDVLFADYYGKEIKEFIDNEGVIHHAFGVRDDVHKILNKYNLFSEWMNPGQLGVYDVSS
jgi:hypothetical protein